MSKTGYVGCKNYTRLLVTLVERTTASDLFILLGQYILIHQRRNHIRKCKPKTFQHPHIEAIITRRPNRRQHSRCFTQAKSSPFYQELKLCNVKQAYHSQHASP
jgi:hypothetical protein